MQESPRCVSPFQRNLFSLHCLDFHAEDRLTPRLPISSFAPWHNPKFIVDEDALTVGPEMFFAFAMEYGKDNENA